MEIGIVNLSKHVDAATFKRGVAVCQMQETEHLAPTWSRIQMVITAYDKIEDVPADSAIGFVQDGLDDPQAEAYHTLDKDRIVLRVDVEACIRDGVIWTVDLSHEIAETGKDPFCNALATDSKGNAWDLEIADWVQGHSYPMSSDFADLPVSNFVFPAAFDPESEGGQYDQMGVLSAPFTIDNGYADYTDPSGQRQQLGARPPRREQAIRHQVRAEREAARTAHREMMAGHVARELGALMGELHIEGAAKAMQAAATLEVAADPLPHDVAVKIAALLDEHGSLVLISDEHGVSVHPGPLAEDFQPTPTLPSPPAASDGPPKACPVCGHEGTCEHTSTR